MNEITVIYDTGKTVYFTVQDSTFKFYNGTTFETYSPSNRSQYKRALTVNPSDATTYIGSFPILPAGQYLVRVWDQITSNPEDTDPFLVAGVMNWNGQNEIPGMPFGNGINILTITAKDQDNNLLDGVLVRVSKGDTFFEWMTNDLGSVFFSVIPGTWNVRYYKNGYLGGEVDIIVNGDLALPVTMTRQFVVPAPQLAKCNCWQVARTAQGDPNPGARFEFNLIKAPTVDDDSFSTKNFFVTAGENGLLQVALPRTARYEYRYGRRASFKPFTVPNAPTFRMPEVDSDD